MSRSNLLGDNFKPYVRNQINLRQQVLGNKTKTNEQIVWENGNSAYVALASSINIENQPDIPIYELPPSVLLSSEFADLREEQYKRMQELYVPETTDVGTYEQKNAEKILSLAEKYAAAAEERDQRALNLPELTNAQAEDYARKFKKAFEGTGTGNYTDEEDIDKYLEEILTVQRFKQVNEAWRRLRTNGTIKSDYASLRIGFDKEGWPKDYKVPTPLTTVIRPDGAGYYLIDIPELKKFLEEEIKRKEEIDPLLPTPVEEEAPSENEGTETGGDKPVPSGTIQIGAFKVNLKDGPANHAARPLGNWQSDNAWDLFAPVSTPIPSLTEGKVSRIKDNGLDGDVTYGVNITVTGANGYPDIFYTHTKNVTVEVGDSVTKGQILGYVAEWLGHSSAMTHVHIGLPEGKHLAELVGYENPTLPETLEDFEGSYEAVEIGKTGIYMPPQSPPVQSGTIPGSDYGTKRIQQLGLEGTPETYLGNYIAKNLVLTSGVITINEDGSRVYKSGVANDLSTFNNFAYGFGGDQDWGLVGMPGLLGVDIKSKNMGSLREASIQIRANSEKQFALIDALYCRIGYTMFLEWGHSVYYDNNGEYQSNPLIAGVPSLIPTFLNPGEDACVSVNKGIQNKIEANRLVSSGNYDAFLGRVSNFTWEFDSAGYYMITLNLISIGDIVESLQIDNPIAQTKPTAPLSPASNIQPNNTSALSKFLSIAATPDGKGVFYGDRFSLLGDDRSNEIIANTFSTYKTTLKANNSFEFREESGWWSFLGKPLSVVATIALDLPAFVTLGTAEALTLGFVDTPSLTPVTDWLIYSPEIGSYVTKTRETGEQSDYAPGLDYSRPGNSIGRIISGRAAFGKNTYNYIRFGDILDFIKEKLLIYNSLCDKEPILDINTDLYSNFCYYSGANVSADPSKVMVAVDLPVSIGYLKNFAEKNAKEEGDGNPSYKKYWEHDIYQSSVFKNENAKLESFATNQAFIGTTENIQAGLIMNIYFEYDYLLTEMDANRNEENKQLNLYDFINSLLKTANSVLGGINQLSIRIEDDNVLRIYDQVSLYGSQPEPNETDVPTINLYGLNNSEGSFVKNFSIQTQLTNEFATQVTVGAQAQGSKDTTDALALSNWNYGLIDRLIPEKNGKNTLSKPSATYDQLINVRDQVFFLWLGYSNGIVGQYKIELDDDVKIRYEASDDNPNPEFEGLDVIIENQIYNFENFQTDRFSEFVKLQQEFMKLLHINSDYNSNQQGMIPISINVELQGISGLRIYDNMRVDTRFIPSYYPQTLNWIIKGVSHSIVDNKWTTKLDTIAVPKLPKIPNGKTPLSSTKTKSYNLIPLFDLIEQDNTPGEGGSGGTDSSIPTDGKGVDRLKYWIGQNESQNKYEIANNGTAGSLSTTTVTDKTIGSLLDIYANVSGKERVFAMGRMQIVPGTLAGVLSRSRVKNAGITKDSKFNGTTQEVLFDTLIYDVRPNLGNYILGKNSGTQADLEAAINAIGWEWAFAPVVKQSSGDFTKNLLQNPNWKGANYKGSAGNPGQSKYTIKQVAELLIAVRTDIVGNAPPFVL